MLKPLLVLFLAAILPVTALGQTAPFQGTWEWIVTEYSNGEFETPVSVGHTKQFYFGPEGAFVHFIDEQRFAEGLWYSGEVVVGSCMVEILSVDSENWVWSIEEGGVQLLNLQTGFECPSGGGSPVVKVERFIFRGTVATEAESWGAVKSLYR